MKYIYITILIILQITQMSATQLSGVISSDIVLKKSKSPYVINSDLVIAKNADIQIESGVELEISKNVNITVLGSLATLNESNENVVFRGYNADNWGSIIFYSANDQDTSRLENVVFRNGGTNYHPPIILKSEIVPIFIDINFIDCSEDKVELAPFDFTSLKITDSAVDYLINNDFIIPAASVFEISSGINIYINPNIDIICKGQITAIGDFTNPINFQTSKNSYWGGISIESDLLDQSVFRFCNLNNFGNSQLSSYAGITVVKGSALIEYTTFNDFNRYAVIIKKNGLADLGGGYAASKGYNQFGIPKLTASVIVSNFSSSNISAQYNCWGTNDNSEIEKKIFDNSDNTTVGIVDYSNFLDDCTVKTPDIPLLEYPYHNASEMPTNLKCTWFSVQNADLFHFQISEDSLFNKVISYKDNLVDTFAFARNLSNGKRYFWRARSVNMAGQSEWSDYSAFKTFDTSKPEPPVIIYPKNNAKDIATKPLIEWSNIDNADKYILEWSKNSNFSDSNLDTSLSNSEEINLKYDTEYFIRVKAGNNRGWSAWSLENKFTTAPLFSKQKINLPITDEIVQIVPCHLDANNRKDLAVRTKNKLYLFLNTGDNYSKAFETNISDVDFDYSDFDKDIDLDFIAINQDKSVFIIENDKGKFKIFGQSFDTDVDAAFFYDFDNNLMTDIITMKSGTKTEVNIFENIISGFVPKNNFISNIRFTSVIKDDFDNDGIFDFILISGPTAKIVGLKESDIIEKANITFLTEPQKLLIRDIDADSYKDVITLEKDGEIACIYSYSLSNNYVRMSLHKEIGLEDFDLVDLSNNGFYDFVFSYGNSIQIREYINFSFFDFYSIDNSNDFSYISYCNLDTYNNDFMIREGNEYYVYLNHNDIINSEPTAPKALTFSIYDNTINLSWSKGKDNESLSLSYSLVVYNENDQHNTDVLFDLPISKSRNVKLNNIKSGRYKWRVRTHDNTFLYSTFSEESEFITPDLIASPPSTWDFEKQTGEHSILVLDPDHFKDSVSMHSGVYIGVFYVNDTTLSCAGYEKYNPDHSTAIPLWGDNYITSMIKEGFDQKELIRYKIWDGIKSQEKFVQIDIDLLKNRFLPDKVFKADIAREPFSLEINHLANHVKYVSANIELCDPFLKDLENKVQIYTNNKSVRSKNDPISPLKAFYSVSNTDLSVNLQGYEIQPIEYKIELNKGWNLIPYLKADTSTVNSAFEFYSDKIICVKDDEGNAFIPQFNVNTLQYLTPGKAYLAYSFESLDFYYNDIIDKDYNIQTEDENKYTSDYFATGNTMSLIINCEDASNGSSIAIRNNNAIVGTGTVTDGKAYITVWGDNPFTASIDGALVNEMLDMEIYDFDLDKSKNIVITSIIDVLNSEKQYDDIAYNENTILYIQAEYDDTSVEESLSTPITIGNNKIESHDYIKSYEIFDYTACLISKDSNYSKKYVDLTDLKSGFYIIKLTIDQKIYTEKLIINK